MRKIPYLGLALVATTIASPVFAQANPFVPPAASGGLSKAQVEAIIKNEISRSGAAGVQSPGPGGPGGVGSVLKNGTASAVGGLPSQGGGVPNANTAAGGGKGGAVALAAPDDPVGKIMDDGGQFVGCVSNTPVFKDKNGRRAYFTTKELKASNAARLYARCG